MSGLCGIGFLKYQIIHVFAAPNPSLLLSRPQTSQNKRKLTREIKKPAEPSPRPLLLFPRPLNSILSLTHKVFPLRCCRRPDHIQHRLCDAPHERRFSEQQTRERKSPKASTPWRSAPGLKPPDQRHGSVQDVQEVEKDINSRQA